MDGTPQLWQTDPSGNYSAWKAACTGRSSKQVREMLEEEYQPDMNEDECVCILFLKFFFLCLFHFFLLYFLVISQ